MRYETALEKWKSLEVTQALAVLDDIIHLSPRNVNAVQLKVEILEELGLFEGVSKLIRNIAHVPGLSDDLKSFLRQKLLEEKISQFYIEQDEEGSRFSAPSVLGFWVSLFGIVTSLIFISMSHFLLFSQKTNQSFFLLIFFLLVILPWLLLMYVNQRNVQSYLMNTQGLTLKYFSKNHCYRWDQMTHVFIQSDLHQPKHRLSLHFQQREGEDLVIDLSRNSPLFYCRKAFLKEVLKYIPSLSHFAFNDKNELIWESSHSQVGDEDRSVA